MKIHITRAALTDLRQTYRFVAQENVTAAKSLVAKMEASFVRIADFPECGRPGRYPGTRELVVPRTPYIIAYRVRGQVITVLAVVHGRQAWPSSFPDT